MMQIFKLFQRIWDNWHKTATIDEDGLETISEYHQRWRSIHIAYFTIFLMSLGFSVIVTGVWPYLDKVRIMSYFTYMRIPSSLYI